MSVDHFDEACAAVQAALDAGARYADARVMLRRTETMTRPRRRRRGSQLRRERRHRRAGAGRVELGLLRRARPVRRRGPGGRAAGRARSPRPAPRCPGPPIDLVPAGAGDGAAGPAPCEIDPLVGAAVRPRATCWCAATAAAKRRRRRPGRGHLPDLGHPQVVRLQRRATASTSTSASAAPGITASAYRRRRDPAPVLAVAPRAVRHPRLGAGRRARPGRQRAADGRGGPRAADRAAVPVRRDHADPRRRAARPADPRVGRARHRAGPDPRLGGRVRRHLLARPRPARHRCATAPT